MEDYGDSIKLQNLARSLEGRTIKTAGVKEYNQTAVVELGLDDGRTIDIGVSGNLHDEAYLIFEQHKNRTMVAPVPVQEGGIRFTSVCVHCRDSIESVPASLYWRSYEDGRRTPAICEQSRETGHHEPDDNETPKLVREEM